MLKSQSIVFAVFALLVIAFPAHAHVEIIVSYPDHPAPPQPTLKATHPDGHTTAKLQSNAHTWTYPRSANGLPDNGYQLPSRIVELSLPKTMDAAYRAGRIAIDLPLESIARHIHIAFDVIKIDASSNAVKILKHIDPKELSDRARIGLFWQTQALAMHKIQSLGVRWHRLSPLHVIPVYKFLETTRALANDFRIVPTEETWTAAAWLSQAKRIHPDRVKKAAPLAAIKKAIQEVRLLETRAFVRLWAWTKQAKDCATKLPRIQGYLNKFEDLPSETRRRRVVSATKLPKASILSSVAACVASRATKLPATIDFATEVELEKSVAGLIDKIEYEIENPLNFGNVKAIRKKLISDKAVLRNILYSRKFTFIWKNAVTDTNCGSRIASFSKYLNEFDKLPSRRAKARVVRVVGVTRANVLSAAAACQIRQFRSAIRNGEPITVASRRPLTEIRRELRGELKTIFNPALSKRVNSDITVLNEVLAAHRPAAKN